MSPKNQILNGDKVFMFSSVHNWMDTRILNKEAISLVEQGKRVEFYAVGNKNDAPQIQGINFHLTLQKKKWLRPLNWLFLAQEIIKSDAKFYHFHDAELLCLTSFIRKKKPDAVIIYDMHEYFVGQISTKDWLPAMLRKPISNVIKIMEKRMMRFCDGVIYAEKSYQQYFPEYKGITEEILNYPLQVKRKNAQKESVFTLIYVGDITEDRNIMGMIEVAKLLKERGFIQFQMKLIGPVTETLRIKVAKKVKEFSLENMIHFYGRIPYEAIWTHYFSAHVGLCLLKPIPNYKNSMATKLYEYMAASLPILASNFPDWSSLLSENNCGLVVDPTDFNQITQLVEQLEGNNKLSQELGINGRKAFERKYSWESQADKLGEFYMNLGKKKVR